MKAWLSYLADAAAAIGSIVVLVLIGLPAYVLVVGAALPVLALGARERASMMLPEICVLALIWPITLAVFMLHVAVGARRALPPGDGTP